MEGMGEVALLIFGSTHILAHSLHLTRGGLAIRRLRDTNLSADTNNYTEYRTFQQRTFLPD